MLAGIISSVFGFIEVILVARLVLRMLGANAANSLVNSIYSISQWLISPFATVFNQPTVTVGSAASFEVATLVAIVAYAIIGWLILMLVGRRPQ